MSKQVKGTQALLIWAKRCTEGYKNVKVENFHSSWRDGLAFCAIIHKYFPTAINFTPLVPANALQNNQLAFDTAEKLGVPALLDAEDMLVEPKPDQFSVMTYVSQMYHVFEAKKNSGGGIASITVDSANTAANNPPPANTAPAVSNPSVPAQKPAQNATVSNSNPPLPAKTPNQNRFSTAPSSKPALSTPPPYNPSNTPSYAASNTSSNAKPPVSSNPPPPTDKKPPSGENEEICAKCNKQLEGDVIQAVNKYYHQKCFGCFKCGKALRAKFLPVEGNPYCEQCGKSTFIASRLNRRSTFVPNPDQNHEEQMLKDRREQAERALREKQEEEARHKREKDDREGREKADREKREKEDMEKRDREKREKEDRERREKEERERKDKEERDRQQKEKEKKEKEDKEKRERDERERKDREERLAREKKEKEEKERRDKEERERVQKEKEAKERRDKEDRERVQKEKEEKERREREDRLAREKREQEDRERKEKEERERKERERKEKEALDRLQKEERDKKELEFKIAREKREAEEKERQQKEKEKREAEEKAAREKREKEDKQQQQKEKEEKAKRDAEDKKRAEEAEARKKEQEERDRKDREEQERIVAAKAREEKERKEKEERQQREEKLEKEREEAERIEREREGKFKKEKEDVAKAKQIKADAAATSYISQLGRANHSRTVSDTTANSVPAASNVSVLGKHSTAKPAGTGREHRNTVAVSAVPDKTDKGDNRKSMMIQDRIKKAREEREAKEAEEQKNLEAYKKNMQNPPSLPAKPANSNTSTSTPTTTATTATATLSFNKPLPKEGESGKVVPPIKIDLQKTSAVYNKPLPPPGDSAGTPEKVSPRGDQLDKVSPRGTKAGGGDYKPLPPAPVEVTVTSYRTPEKVSPRGATPSQISPRNNNNNNYAPASATPTRITPSKMRKEMSQPHISDEDVLLEGHLMKQKPQGFFRHWQHRRFVLTTKKVVYYIPDESIPKGYIDLRLINRIDPIGDDRFMIHVENRVYFLEAENMDERDQWMYTIDVARKKVENIIPALVQTSQENTLMKKEGWLQKKAFFGFDKVWVVLRGGMMNYSEGPNKKHLGRIQLYKSKLREYEPEKRPACFEITPLSESSLLSLFTSWSSGEIFQASNVVEMHEWINAILKQAIMMEDIIDNIQLNI